ncbi:MAG: RidA family protein [Cellulomonadaceae bacterium]|nr:RidA family protein [Cellulomonadaceae bacterium]
MGDPTCAAAVIADRTVYLSHHAGGFEVADPAHQARAALEAMRATMAAAGGELADVVQIHVYLADVAHLRAVCDVVGEAFGDGPPARMTSTSAFVDARCLVQVDGVAVLP